jgi:hypothetical protein
MGRIIGDILAVKPDYPAGRRFKTDDKLEQRTLASPVGANDGKNLPIVGPHGHFIDSSEAAKVLLDLIQLE